MMDAEHNAPHRLSGRDTGEGKDRAEDREHDKERYREEMGTTGREAEGPVGEARSEEERSEESEEESDQRSGLVVLLDRVIVTLMVAIVLAMSWPVGMVFYGQSRPIPAQVAVGRETNPPETPPDRQSPGDSGSGRNGSHEGSTDSGTRRVTT